MILGGYLLIGVQGVAPYSKGAHLRKRNWLLWVEMVDTVIGVRLH